MPDRVPEGRRLQNAGSRCQLNQTEWYALKRQTIALGMKARDLVLMRWGAKRKRDCLEPTVLGLLP